MKVIIPRVPASTTDREIRHLVDNLLAKRFRLPFTPPPKASDCSVLAIKDSNGACENHGLVTIHPDSVAKWLISHFKGQHIHKKQVFAREYVVRTQRNDNFAGDTDRRRVGLKISKVHQPHVETVGMRGFAKVHQ